MKNSFYLFKSEMGRPLKELVEFPEYLTYSLECQSTGILLFLEVCRYAQWLCGLGPGTPQRGWVGISPEKTSAAALWRPCSAGEPWFDGEPVTRWIRYPQRPKSKNPWDFEFN
ncbi:hypothetical protein ACFX13_029133 [Malus domestica]